MWHFNQCKGTEQVQVYSVNAKHHRNRWNDPSVQNDTWSETALFWQGDNSKKHWTNVSLRSTYGNIRSSKTYSANVSYASCYHAVMLTCRNKYYNVITIYTNLRSPCLIIQSRWKTLELPSRPWNRQTLYCWWDVMLCTEEVSHSVSGLGAIRRQ